MGSGVYIKCSKCKCEKPPDRSNWCLACKSADAKARRVARGGKNYDVKPLPALGDLFKFCTKCKLTHDTSNFSGPTASWCKPCKKDAEALARLKSGVTPKRKWDAPGECKKICRECEITLLLSDFSPSLRGVDGVSAYCRPCASIEYKTTPENARRYAQKYRDSHPERYHTNHRMHQAKRRGIVGNFPKIPDADLKILYATETCTYCDQITPYNLRTLDHVVPLVKGGIHALENLVMACKSCNSSKSDKDLDKWLSQRV